MEAPDPAGLDDFDATDPFGELGRPRESGDSGDSNPDAVHGLDHLADLDEIRRFIERTTETMPGDVPSSMIALEKIPRRLWEQTLAPLHRQQRVFIAMRVPDRQLRNLASQLAFALDMDECGRANERAVARGRAMRRGAPLPTPAADHATRRSSAQVNMRVRRDDHERLRQAAEAVGCRPTTLARSLVLNGVAMILQDHALQR